MERSNTQPRTNDEGPEAGQTPRTILPKYHVITELGRGGMADVLLAMARGPAGFNKLTVLKQIREDVAKDTRFLDMLLDEARLAAQLNHPNIVQTNEVGVDEQGRFFIAMEYLEGQSVAKVLQRLRAHQRELPLRKAVRIAAGALSGLHYAHELVDFTGKRLEVVHCDLSPHNLFVTYVGQVKVLDFGLARAKSSATQTMSGEIRGKLYYMAPEQAMAQHVDRRADIFAMGVVLWEMLTGHQLWRGQTDIAVACNLRFGEIPRLAQVAPDLPRSLSNVCQKALAFRPEERYATALEFQTALESVQDELPGHASAEDLGALVANLFSEDRSAIRKLVESHMAERETPPSAIVPEAQPGVLPRSSSQPPPAAPSSATEMPRKRNRLAYAVSAAVGLVMLTIGAFWWRQLPSSSLRGATAVPALGPPSVATQLSVPPEATMVPVEIRVRPAGARVFWDDRPLSGNPFRGQFVRDVELHRVRVEAPGYQTQSRVVTLDSDLTLDMSLEAETPEAEALTSREPRASKSKVPKRVPPVQTPEPVPEPRPAFEDPWGGQ